MKIKKIFAQEILDSRGSPTIKTNVILEDDSIGWAAVPSGASTGKHEAVELRDQDLKRYNGQGVLKAVDNVNNKIAPILINQEANDQKQIDQKMIELDGTENKSQLGANAILSVSMAVARAAASAEKKPFYQYLTKFNPDFQGKYIMPVPMMNIMNGGKHANWATDIQEYMIIPIKARSIVKAVQVCAEIYFHLKKILKNYNYSVNIGDEGGYAPAVQSNEEPFKFIVEAVEKAGYQLGENVFLAIDAAASEFYQNKAYELKKAGIKVSADELSNFYKKIMTQYPIISLEDIFGEDDWSAFASFTQATGNEVQIVGDDIYATNIKRIERGIQEKTTNSVLIKLNQIGTLTETVEAILLARKNNWTSVVSHRSGETEDSFIADFCVAMGCGQIKTGAPARSERVCKYNRLMEIERELGDKTSYFKFPFLK